jgi:excisionase family DNA binding protein
MIDIKTYYTVEQFAKKKNVTKEAVYLAIGRGGIDATRIGRQWFIPKTTIFKFQKRKYTV